MDYNICPACGATYLTGEKFCQNCGSRLPANPPVPPANRAPAAPVYEADTVLMQEQPAAPAAPAYQPVQNAVPNYAPNNAPVYAPNNAPAYQPESAPAPAAPGFEDPFAEEPKKKNTGLIIGLCVAGGVALIAIIAVVLLLTLSSSPSSIALSQTALNMSTSDSVQLTATIAPEKASDDKLTWTSSNEDVATVYNGKVTAWDVGSCTITATTSNGLSATCSVTVEAVPYMVDMSEYWIELETGDTRTLDVTVYPENATNYTVTWSSDDTSVATVSGGTVTAVGEGSCTITASVSDNVYTTCSVSVSAAEEPTQATEAPTEPNNIETSAYDKYVLGEWKLVYYYDFDTGTDYPVEDYGLSGKIVFRDDHTANLTTNGETWKYTWYFDYVDDWGDYCFWLDNGAEALPFDYIVDKSEIWLYTDETTLTYQK